ncbi:hypothetical protein Tco_0044660 [Tanacetum coccineum]
MILTYCILKISPTPYKSNQIRALFLDKAKSKRKFTSFIMEPKKMDSSNQDHHNKTTRRSTDEKIHAEQVIVDKAEYEEEDSRETDRAEARSDFNFIARRFKEIIHVDGEEERVAEIVRQLKDEAELQREKELEDLEKKASASWRSWCNLSPPTRPYWSLIIPIIKKGEYDLWSKKMRQYTLSLITYYGSIFTNGNQTTTDPASPSVFSPKTSTMLQTSRRNKEEAFIIIVVVLIYCFLPYADRHLLNFMMLRCKNLYGSHKKQDLEKRSIKEDAKETVRNNNLRHLLLDLEELEFSIRKVSA